MILKKAINKLKKSELLERLIKKQVEQGFLSRIFNGEKEQLIITQKLMFIERLIHDQQSQLALVDQLVKSQFVREVYA